MRLTHKIYAAIAAAIVVGALFFITDQRTEQLLEAHGRTLGELGRIEGMERQLDQHLANAAFQLYYAYDPLNHLLDEIRGAVAGLQQGHYLDGEVYVETRAQLARYRTLLEEKEALIERFATLNSPLKNSAILVPAMSSRYLRTFGSRDREYLHHLSQLTAAVSLASRSLDADFLDELRESLAALEEWEFDDPAAERFNETFLAHVRVIDRLLPDYAATLERIRALPTVTALGEIQGRFLGASRGEAERIRLLSHGLLAAFLIAVSVIVYFLVVVDREHKELVQLHRGLEEAAATDRLTGLGNRFAYEHHRHHAIRRPGILVLNVNGFKHINNFYGHRAGDQLLRQLAGRLKEVLAAEEGTRLYRLGADEFGVLVDLEQQPEVLRLALALIVAAEEGSYRWQGYELPVSVTLGMSREAPLLEKADMALRYVRRTRVKYLEYHPDLGLEETVKENLRVLGVLREALERGAVIPHYQPVLNNHTQRIEYYECLVRIEDRDGRLMVPGQFLQVAKEGHLYGNLSRAMIERCIARFRDLDYGFSLNLSIEDIMDEAVTGFLFRQLDENPSVRGRISLEILESEQVENYEAVRDFVQEARERGCKIAIDDFGAGYSSLSQVLKLNVDVLKIDASLIKSVDRDHNSQVVVRAVLDFARDVSIQYVTAEFVHSREVYDKVCAMGVDYSQGYYIGKPEREPAGEPLNPV